MSKLTLSGAFPQLAGNGLIGRPPRTKPGIVIDFPAVGWKDFAQ